MTLLFFGLFAFSLALSFVATREVRDIATRRGWVSTPGGRHLHETARPRLGGVAIFLAFSLSLTLWLVLSLIFPRLVAGVLPTTLLRIYVPACLIFCLGIYDDLYGAGPYVKFAVQAIAAAMLFAGGMRVLDLPLIFPHTLPWYVGLPLTVLWVVAVTNAFNLIDGLDGLAAGSALFSTLVFFVVALVNQSWLCSLMSVTLAGAILGFLRFNFNPATIFLGDSGSLFIGFLLGSISLLDVTHVAGVPTLVFAPVTVLAIPVFDTLFVSVTRRLRGQPISQGGTDHSSHRLVRLGLEERRAVLLLYAL